MKQECVFYMSNKTNKNYRYRLAYSRTGAMSWLAHLDLMRNFQYACRRAKLPIAFTKGYNPRQIMEFALPVGVGIETRKDPVDLELLEKISVESIITKLNVNLPNGIKIESAKYLDYPVKSLMSLVEAAAYTLKTDNLGPATEKVILVDSELIIVKRKRKGKTQEYNLRELILKVEIISNNEVKLFCKAGSVANLRPDMLLKALYERTEITKIAALDAIIVRDNVYLKNGG